METELLSSLSDACAALSIALASTGGIMLVLFLAGLALLWVFFIRIYIAYRMAKNRHRDPLGWVLLSFFVSPLLVWILLLIVGEEKH